MSARVYILPEPQNVLRAAEYTWHYRDGTSHPGVGLFVDRTLIQHLTAEQALELSNQLTDSVDNIQTKEN